MTPSHSLREVLDRLIAERADAFAAVFERERRVPLAPLGRAIGAAGVDRLTAAGLLEMDGAAVAPRIRVDRVGGPLLVASDLRRHRLQRDFVVGPGPASFLLARHVRPAGRGPVLDLGTGSGIQGLLAAGPGERVLALDINARAVDFARFNATLNGRPDFRVEVGDFLAADAGRRHDGVFATVIANPPFVLSPAAEVTYRDRSLPADEVGARTVEHVARSLTRGGRGYVLCNWIDRGGEWSAPVRAWLAGSRVDAAVVRISTLSPATYASVWTRDLGAAERPAAEQRWRTTLIAEGIERIHLGVVALARPRVPRIRGRFNAWDGPRDPEIGRKVEHALAG